MDLKAHARREMLLVGLSETDDRFVHAMEIIDLVLEQDPKVDALTISLVYQLCNFETLAPLLGSDDEWDAVSRTLWQNVRCPRVFKDLSSGAYDTRAIVFVNEKDQMFTKQPQSRRAVTFPYSPQTEYVRVRTGSNLVLPNGEKAQ